MVGGVSCEPIEPGILLLSQEGAPNNKSPDRLGYRHRSICRGDSMHEQPSANALTIATVASLHHETWYWYVPQLSL